MITIHDVLKRPVVTEKGITLAALGSGKDPRRPVPVITIGLGPDSDHAALAAISRQTGGSTYQAQRASDIYRVFHEAMGRRECLPTC